ncbi:MAG: hypothetical protein ACXV5L_04050 [Thermoanaerobaculia bacterium]
MLLNRTKTSTLFTLGLALMAVRGVLQLLIDRTGHSNNITDFALGLMFGLGAGLLLLVAWRNGRRLRGQ